MTACLDAYNKAAVATGQKGQALEEKTLLLTQANSTYVTQSKHVKVHLSKPKSAKPKAKGTAKAAPKAAA